MDKLVKQQDVIDILMVEYKSWRDTLHTDDGSDLIAIGAIGSISNVLWRIMVLKNETAK